MKRQVKEINMIFITEKVNAKYCFLSWCHVRFYEHMKTHNFRNTKEPRTETEEESTRNVAVMRWKWLLIMLKRTTWRRHKFLKHLHELRTSACSVVLLNSRWNTPWRRGWCGLWGVVFIRCWWLWTDNKTHPGACSTSVTSA